MRAHIHVHNLLLQPISMNHAALFHAKLSLFSIRKVDVGLLPVQWVLTYFPCQDTVSSKEHG